MAAAASETYGLLAEFSEPEDLVAAVRRVRAEGYKRIEACTPFPVHDLAEAIGFPRSRMPLVVLIGALVGGSGGYALQYWVSVIAYPLNIGGRPLHSWPAFMPVTFECTILAAAIFGLLGMFALNGLPRPHHPLFNVRRFDHASQDKFFLCIEAADGRFHMQTTRKLLQELQADGVYEVPMW